MHSCASWCSVSRNSRKSLDAGAAPLVRIISFYRRRPYTNRTARPLPRGRISRRFLDRSGGVATTCPYDLMRDDTRHGRFKGPFAIPRVAARRRKKTIRQIGRTECTRKRLNSAIYTTRRTRNAILLLLTRQTARIRFHDEHDV